MARIYSLPRTRLGKQKLEAEGRIKPPARRCSPRRIPAHRRAGCPLADLMFDVPFQVAATFSEAPHQLPPFHSEIAISCLSLGTNVFSEASSTIKRYASRIIA
jgi:hypothetical protein